MKICSTCKVEKNLEDFSKSKLGMHGRSSKCKACNKLYFQENKIRLQEVYKRFHENKKDGYYYVYLLPVENYVGQTNSLKQRMYTHKLKGRDTSNYSILGKFIDREDALQIEKEYHDKGYLGAK